MKDNTPTVTELPSAFVWLADAPLFIDTEQVYSFYDAVVRPEAEEDRTTLEITEQNIDQIRGKLGLEASVSLSQLGAILSSVFAFIKPELRGSGEGEYQRDSSEQRSITVELHPITTPQRQLEQLTLHYLVNRQERLYFVEDPKEEKWRDPETISQVPRELAFLDLPSQQKASKLGLPETKLIPTAAEFENGKIETLFDKIKSRDRRTIPPEYPEKGTAEELQDARKKYWGWFNENFSATQAMLIVEDAATKNGKLRWIDYRVPLTQNGDTLHLHVSPSGNYDTGVFAYNFVKRGYKHGLRLVGTLKSEPDMNVLAIYDK